MTFIKSDNGVKCNPMGRFWPLKIDKFQKEIFKCMLRPLLHLHNTLECILSWELLHDVRTTVTSCFMD